MKEDKQEILELYYLLKEQLEEVEKKILEYKSLKDVIESLESIKEEVFINIGGFVFTKVRFLDKHTLLVNVGNNIYVEKNREEVLKIIEKYVSELEEYKKELTEQIQSIKEQLEK